MQKNVEGEKKEKKRLPSIRAEGDTGNWAGSFLKLVIHRGASSNFLTKKERTNGGQGNIARGEEGGGRGKKKRLETYRRGRIS